MATESFIVTALPHSVAEDADVHVAVFIAPEIVPDAPGQELGELDAVPGLGHDGRRRHEDRAVRPGRDDRVHRATSTASTRRSGRRCSRPTPRSLNRREPDLAERRWRTFRPAYLHDAAKLLHAAAMFSDPTSPPLPSRHPLTEPLIGYLRPARGVRRERYDESQVDRSCTIGPSASSRAPTRRCRTRASTRRDGRARPLRPRAAPRPAVLRAAGVGIPVPGPADRRGGHAEAGAAGA